MVTTRTRSSASPKGRWALTAVMIAMAFIVVMDVVVNVAHAFPEDRVVFPDEITDANKANSDSHDSSSNLEDDEPIMEIQSEDHEDINDLTKTLSEVDHTNDEEDHSQEDSEPIEEGVDHTDHTDTNEDSKEESLSCSLSENKLPYVSEESGEEQCVQLTARGPCQENEWFVLRKPEPEETDYQPEGVCVAKKCELFYEVYYNGQCEFLGEGGDCPRGMELLVNPFGDGECDCKEGLIPYTDSEGNVDCFHPFLQGPCQAGEQLREVESEVQTACIPTPCEDESLILWKNELCVKGAPCEQEEEVTFDEELGQVSCVVVLRQLLTIPERCPSGQRKDSSGDCIDSLDLKAENARPKRRLATNNKSVKKFLESRFG